MTENELVIPLEKASLGGEFELPPQAVGLVLFAHGSGSSRYSPRNQHVARRLRAAGLGTLLFDLLTAEEEQAEAYTHHLRFNISFLAGRLMETTRWVMGQTRASELRIGYFGSSTGAAAALMAAAESPEVVGAVVSRGGRPDLAAAALPQVVAPTLLVVGGNDAPVIAMNEEAAARLSCVHSVRLVPGASHLFEEPGALDQAAELAAQWFAEHLQNKTRPLA